jgi:mRNA interferase MazF
VKRGDVRWYRFDKPDKSRPVVVLTRDAIIPHLGEVTVAPVTSTVRDIPSEVLLDTADGMPNACAVNCDHIQTVAKARIGSVITSLPPARMREVRAAMAVALALDA